MWTCVGNSVVFAAVIAVGSLVLGTMVGWGLGQARPGVIWVWRGVVGSLLAVGPVFVACGIRGYAARRGSGRGRLRRVVRG